MARLYIGLFVSVRRGFDILALRVVSLFLSFSIERYFLIFAEVSLVFITSYQIYKIEREHRVENVDDSHTTAINISFMTTEQVTRSLLRYW